MLCVSFGSSDCSGEVSQAVIVGDEASSVAIPVETETATKGFIIVPQLLRGGAAAVYCKDIERYKPPRARHALLKNMLLYFTWLISKYINSKKTSKGLRSNPCQPAIPLTLNDSPITVYHR